MVSPADAVLPLPSCLEWGSPPGWLKTHAARRSAPSPLGKPSEPLHPGRERAAPEPTEPRAAQAQIERASRLRSSGKLEEAEQLLAIILNQDPSNVVAWYLLGEALLDRGEQAQANLAFRRAQGLSARDSRWR